MTSSLSTLAKNLITPDLSKFRETAKAFNPDEMAFVTRKGIYPYEYTDSWDKLLETRLPHNIDFYSTLTESDVSIEDYEHAPKV